MTAQVEPGGDLVPSEIEVWFRAELERILPGLERKAYDRGAYDLKLLGQTMAGLLDVNATAADRDRHHLLLGLLFYMEGKIARALSALKEGRLPHDDDWLDLSIYARMAGYITERGTWP